MSEHSRVGDLETVNQLVRSIQIGLLTTFDRAGHFHTRPVQTMQVEPHGRLWFFTDWSSPKVAELEHDVRVSLGYANPANNTYVAISGTGRLLQDSRKAQELWSMEQRAYYPDGPDDPRLALLAVQIQRAEYWIAPGRLSYLVAAAEAALTGEPVGIIGANRKVEPG